ncbi:MAG: NADH:ubiquinone oxidoreductase [Planctomycetes bacterium]|nr:NADH:ubiquinone oxidoreductase [Planctomycetota bacterium]
MSESLQSAIKEICEVVGNDRTQMMEIVEQVQDRFGCVSSEAMDLIAQQMNCHRVEVMSVVSFYSFLSEKPKGTVVIRLCNDVIDLMKGANHAADAFRDELGIEFGETTPDGKITLEWTPCIGMSDQAPAALINDEVVTYLGSDGARNIARQLKEGTAPSKLVGRLGDGNNANDLVKSMVHNNIRNAGPVVFAEGIVKGDGLKKALAMSPREVINDVKNSRLRGRGGAGFPTGMKWDFTRQADGDKKYIFCNADEGEPGTFKDRVILTEKPDLMFEGMTIGGYAIGADEGILYLRGEYAYLRAFLDDVLANRRDAGLLGKNICGKGFDFDIRIVMGAGAYICGEETALLSSAEGMRGDPKNRPPFPAQKGYRDCPTAVNNVETFCKVTRILEKGPGWFSEIGSEGSAGTKLLSISGDCHKPGVYEVPFGIKLREVMDLCGAEDVQAVQIGGPSGRLVGKDSMDDQICYDHLATGGSLMVFSRKRNLLKKVLNFMEFFEEESCGYCTPCRVGNVLLRKKIEAIVNGEGEPADLEYLQTLGETVKTCSRCGLGQTSPNPVLTSLESFRDVYEAALKPALKDGSQPEFDIRAALRPAEAIAGRASSHFAE